MAALLDEKYVGRILSITGPESLTFGDATQIIGRATGKTLVYQTISDEEAGERYSRISGSAEETAAHVALWRAIREGRLAATTNGVEQALGRRPIFLKQWAVRKCPQPLALRWHFSTTQRFSRELSIDAKSPLLIDVLGLGIEALFTCP